MLAQRMSRGKWDHKHVNVSHTSVTALFAYLKMGISCLFMGIYSVVLLLWKNTKMRNKEGFYCPVTQNYHSISVRAERVVDQY